MKPRTDYSSRVDWNVYGNVDKRTAEQREIEALRAELDRRTKALRYRCLAVDADAFVKTGKISYACDVPGCGVPVDADGNAIDGEHTGDLCRDWKG